MRYLAYDVETPNQKNNAVCSVGWVLLEEQNVLAQGHDLIDPQADFSNFNIRVHHITAADVMGMPTFAEYWHDTLAGLMRGAVVLAHSANFDMSVTRKALAAAGIEAPRIQYYDTLEIFRALYSAESYKLADLAAAFGFSYNAHSADADSLALVRVLDCLRQKLGYADFSSMFAAARVARFTMKDDLREQKIAGMGPYERNQARIAAIIQNALDHGVDFSEIHFCLQGQLDEPYSSRVDGVDKIVEALGGVCHNKPSAKVDYFVWLNETDTINSEKARQLAQDEKNHLRVIGPNAFLDLLAYRTDKPDLSGPAQIRARKQAEREAAEKKAQEEQSRKSERAAALEAKKAAAAAKEAQPAKPLGHPVIQLDGEGNALQSFPSVAMAAEALGISTKVIRDAANGKQRTAGGFRWKFAEDANP